MAILQTEQVAELLHVNKRTIQNHAQSGVYPQEVCMRYGRKYFFNKDELLKWLFSGKAAQAVGMGA